MHIITDTLDFLSFLFKGPEAIESAKSYGAGACGVGIGLFNHIDIAQITGWLQLIAGILGVVVMIVRLMHDIKEYRKK